MTEKERIRNKKNYKKAKLAYDEFIKVYPFETEDLKGEHWNIVPGYNDNYLISTFGRTYSIKSGKILKPLLQKNGYLIVNLWKDGKQKHRLIHLLVAEAFVPNPENKPEINHYDGIKFNCYFENLIRATRLENLEHAFKLGLQKSAADCSFAKFTNEQVREIRRIYKPRDKENSTYALAKKFNVSQTAIQDIIHYKTYKNVE